MQCWLLRMSGTNPLPQAIPNTCSVASGVRHSDAVLRIYHSHSTPHVILAVHLPAALGACCTSRRQASPSPTWTCLQAASRCMSGGRGAPPSPCCDLTPPVSQHRNSLAVSGAATFRQRLFGGNSCHAWHPAACPCRRHSHPHETQHLATAGSAEDIDDDFDEDTEQGSAGGAPPGAQAVPLQSPEGYMCDPTAGLGPPRQDAAPGGTLARQ
jgi:hypothetical protein